MSKTKTERAIKYSFNPFQGQWLGQRCRIIIESEPFAEGGMRTCMRLFELEANGNFMPSVAKIFKRQAISSKSYFDEALTQMVAECFAQEFNRIQEKYRVSFLPVAVMLLEERKNQICCVEPMMRGEYLKHNDNDGHVETNDSLPQSFSHYTWEASRHSLVVVDIQGVGDCYTDPQIHSIEGSSFGTGNMGAQGVLKFLKTHKCNRVCQELRLPTLNRSAAVTQVEKAEAKLREKAERWQASGRSDAASASGKDVWKISAGSYPGESWRPQYKDSRGNSSPLSRKGSGSGSPLAGIGSEVGSPAQTLLSKASSGDVGSPVASAKKMSPGNLAGSPTAAARKMSSGDLEGLHSPKPGAAGLEDPSLLQLEQRSPVAAAAGNFQENWQNGQDRL